MSGSTFNETGQMNVSLTAFTLNRSDTKMSELNQTYDVLSLGICVEVHNASLDEVVVLSQCLVNETLISALGTAYEAQKVVVSNMQNIPVDWACPNGTLKYPRNLNLTVDDSTTYFFETYSTIFNLENIGFELQTFPTENSTPVLLQVATCDNAWPIRCHRRGYIYLNASDFTASNDSLVINNTTETFHDSQFVVFDNGSAIVCSVYNFSYTIRVASFAMMKDYLLEGTVCLVTLSVSMASLVAVLVTYSLLPQLRNVPGVIVMSHSGALLGSQAFMLLAVYPRGWLCLLHSLLIHALVLSSFLWKSVLSFDLLLMLRLKSIESSSHASRTRMLNCYGVVGWVLPAVLVLICWLLDHFEVYDIHYGSTASGTCWLGSISANLYLILVPLGLSWFFNVVCFTIALLLIHRSGVKFRGKAARSKVQRARDRRRLMVSARISMLMGGAWVLCFAAAAVDMDELWLAHSALNGAQGVYLLICFVFKPRVLVMLRDRLSCQKEEARASTAREMTTTITSSSLSAVNTAVDDVSVASGHVYPLAAKA
ncbi:probable G-protein coupled receptor Mth-like 3 [Littorina saxatilis]|uniref:probable G-protein coupled receptor Mth-like 3 n=1 Tax=Littorina saxatilis TaxID=31220 RepID=UPI0038B5A3CA